MVSYRWSNRELDDYARKRIQRHERNEQGYIDVPKLKAQHKSKYLFHAAAYCRDMGVAEPQGEYYFHPSREWRFDLAWPVQKVALEVDGIWVTNAHTGPMQVVRNMEKQNAAVFMGWRVLRCQESEIAKTLKQIADAFLRE